MNFRLRLLSTVAAASMLIGFAVTGARAADVVAEPVAHDWSGLYIGAHVGYGEVYMDGCVDCDDPDGRLDASDLDLNGIVGGGQIGYNYQMDSLVLGVEADFTWTGFDDDANEPSGAFGKVSGDVDYLASIRARAGFAMDDVLIYATGGIAFIDASIETDQNGLHDGDDFNDVGGVVGGGAEFAVTDSISLRAEGLYYFFDDDVDAGDWADANPGEKFELDDAFVVRVGINFFLNGL
jgi:outer membrane immunogenic protein